MDKFSVDENKCKGCGLCEAECIIHDIAVQDGKAHYNDSGNCIECLHCLKICPQSAINYHSEVKATVFDSDENVSAVVTRRSCRNFKQTSLDREALTNVINVANAAPRFDISFDERMFIVLEDEEKINGVRTVLMNQIDRVRKLFGMLAKNPFYQKVRRRSTILLLICLKPYSKRARLVMRSFMVLLHLSWSPDKRQNRRRKTIASMQCPSFLSRRKNRESGPVLAVLSPFFPRRYRNIWELINTIRFIAQRYPVIRLQILPGI